jgi:hypothetical protein
MAQACIGISLLIAGVFLGGFPSAIPATEASQVAETPFAEKPVGKVGRLPCTGSEVCGLKVSQAPAGDTPAAIVSDQIRQQGYACDEPRKAERDREASRPNLTVWVLTCGNATYRVTLIPDMAARVERLK